MFNPKGGVQTGCKNNKVKYCDMKFICMIIRNDLINTMRVSETDEL